MGLLLPATTSHSRRARSWPFRGRRDAPPLPWCVASRPRDWRPSWWQRSDRRVSAVHPAAAPGPANAQMGVCVQLPYCCRPFFTILLPTARCSELVGGRDAHAPSHGERSAHVPAMSSSEFDGAGIGRAHPLTVDPDGHLARVESHELADLHEGDPALGHEPADEHHFDTQPLGQLLHINQRRSPGAAPVVLG